MKTRAERITSERTDSGKILAGLEGLKKSQELMADALHKLRNAIVQRLEPPADLIRIGDAAKRAGISVPTMRRLDARGVFTDHRRGKGQGSMRTYYADEIDTYRQYGEAGVQRLREELGRD